MLLFFLTSVFIIGLLFAKLLDESAKHTVDFNRIICVRKSKLGMIVGSMGLIGCMFTILLLATVL